MKKYSFSGHESFPCKTIWLKKGYDFIVSGNDFNSADAVISLGVGKNMVSSIRYWMRVFGLYVDNTLTSLADYLFDANTGHDPYLEDIASLQLLHFSLVHRGEASLYPLVFCGLQRERQAFEREDILSFIELRMAAEGMRSSFTVNTIRKDIAVLLQSYSMPRRPQSNEDFSSLLIDLELIRQDLSDQTYHFNVDGKRQIEAAIFMYALLIVSREIDSLSLSLDVIMDQIGLAFCMSEQEVISMLRRQNTLYPGIVHYSDVAGIRQLQFLSLIEPESVLDSYYEKQN